MKQSTIDALHEGLWMVINAAGTGGRGKIVGYNVAGKTGTAQVVSNQGKAGAARTGMDVRDHGWFIFFAPHDKPEIAGVIFAEHAEHGYLGAPIAKFAMETYFAKKEGRPLPSIDKPAGPPVAIATANTAPAGTSGQSVPSGASGPTVKCHVRTPPHLPRRLAAHRSAADDRRHRHRDDLQHYVRDRR